MTASAFLDSVASQIDPIEAAKVCILAEKFGLTHFKDFQESIIEAALAKRDTLVIQPTGSGKSLCFQFPAVFTGKLTLVITPTISLMQDQTAQLKEQEIAYLGSAQRDPRAEESAFQKDGGALIVFVSSEWLFRKSGDNIKKVKKAYTDKRLGLIAIDECHLIHDWQDFRPSYKECVSLPQEFPEVPIMALSATVTPQNERKLLQLLINPVIEKASVNRKNVYLEVLPCDFTRKDSSQLSVTLDCRDFNNFADKVQERINPDQCCIVYTDFACHVPAIVLALRDRGIEAVGYYGKMKEGDKEDALLRWRSGEVNVIVATRAFGLGINKADVRYVIRNGMPPCISAWAQECGRAGRGITSHNFL